jgi:proteasome lid subunit RPN8/RPN11
MINSTSSIGNSGCASPVRRSSSEKVIEIPNEIRQQMIDHAVSGLPNEACGLLAGDDGRVERFFPVRNVHPEPDIRFELEPGEYIRAMEEMEGAGQRLMATFHSHTQTAAYPSPTDVEKSGGIQEFHPDARFVLVSLRDAEPVLRAFAIVGDRIEEQEVRIV